MIECVDRSSTGATTSWCLRAHPNTVHVPPASTSTDDKNETADPVDSLNGNSNGHPKTAELDENGNGKTTTSSNSTTSTTVTTTLDRADTATTGSTSNESSTSPDNNFTTDASHSNDNNEDNNINGEVQPSS